MKAQPNDLLMITFLTAGLLLLLPVGIKQTMGQEDDNNDIATTNANSLTGNNTIILNPSEVNGTYRWVNNSGGINPTLDITMGNEYQIKINNQEGQGLYLVNLQVECAITIQLCVNFFVSLDLSSTSFCGFPWT